MIPVLFKENETNFNTNGIGQLKETLDYDVREVRNGEFELYLQYPVSGKWFTELKDFRCILAKPNPIDEEHIFRIYEIVKDLNDQTIHIYATSRSNDLSANLVKFVSVNDETPKQAMLKIKSNLLEPSVYTFDSNITTKSSTQWEMRNPLNCIAGEQGSLVHYWGGELKRFNDRLYLYSRRGKDKVATIKQGKNLDGFTLTSSTKGMITRILPYLRHTPEGSDKEVMIIGNIVSSPLVNNYPIVYLHPVDYSGEENLDTVAKLNTKAASYFTSQNPDCDKPSVNMEIDLLQLADSPEYEKFKNLEQIGLTDTVMVWVEKYNVDVEVKIEELVYNGMKDQVTSLIAGSKATGLFDSLKNDYVESFEKLEGYIQGVENGLQNTIQSTADGLNKIFRGYTEPSASISKKNDIWFKPNGVFEQMYIYDGAYWQLVLDTEDVDKVAKEVNAIVADIVIEKDRVNGVIVNADKAIADAGFAKIDAAKAKVDALNALREAQQAIGNTNTISAGIDSITQALLVKAEKTEVNGLNGRITANTNNILVNATEIRAKLTTAEVNNLINGKSFVTEAKLSATSNSLSASLTEVSKTVGDISFGAKNLILNSKETKYFDYTAPTPDPTISLSPTSKTMNAGDTFTIFATTYPSTENVDWEVSDNAVISVAPDRKSATVIALNTGTSIITASIRGKSRIKTNSYITVNAVGAGSSDEPTLSVTPTSRQLEIGQSFTISATTFPSTESVDWESSDTTIISVTNTGKTTTVRAIKNGFAVVTASIRGKSYIKATASVSVNEVIIPEPTDPTISVSPTTRTLEKGQSFTVTATTNPTSESINWLVSDGRVASTSSSTAKTITVTALEAGTVTLTARIASKPYITAASTVTVTSTAIPDPVGPTISVDIPAITLTVGEKFIIKATTNPDSTPIEWVVSAGGVSLSSPSYRTTTVTALSAGTVILSATVLDDPTIRASCVITIIEDVVIPPDPSIDPYITLSQTSKIMTVGESFLFTATTHPASENVDWTTSNGGVASISGYAKKITAVARSVGSSVITATMRGKTHITGTAQVTVVAARPMSDPYSFSPISRMVLDADEDVDPIVPYAFRDQEMQTFNLIMPMALGSVVYTLSESLAAGTSYIIQAKGSVYGKKVSAYLGNTFIGEMTDGFMKFVLEGYNTSKELSFNSSTTGTRFDEIQLERGTRASDIRPAPEDMATLERAVQIEVNLNGIQTTVSKKAEQSQVTQLSNLLQTKVDSGTYSSKITQVDREINLRVSKSNVIAEINLSAESGIVRIAGKRIQLDGDVVMTTAYIAKIKAIEIVADSITTGVLNAARVRIINLDVLNLTGNTAEFVRTAWNSANSYVNVDSYGLKVTNSLSDFTDFRNGGMTVGRKGVEVGRIQTNYIRENPAAIGLSFDAEPGRFMGWGRKRTASASAYDILMQIPYNKDVLDLSIPIEVGTGTKISNGQIITNIVRSPSIYVNYIRPQTGSEWDLVGGDNQVNMRIANRTISMYSQLNMRNFSIINQSDERKKKGIDDTQTVALDLFRELRFVDFNWRDPKSPKERQFGLIAQEASVLSTIGEDGVWNINTSMQIMYNSLGVKELLVKVEMLESRIKKLEEQL